MALYSCHKRIIITAMLVLGILTIAKLGHASFEGDVLINNIGPALDPSGQLLKSWTQGGNPCSGKFKGVTCNSGGSVANISLQSCGLSGSIPSQFGLLSSLQVLEICCNNLTGSIPESLGSLNLTSLDVHNNSLSGPVPTGLIHAAGSFKYGNNSGLCSAGNDTIVPSIPVCESIIQGNVNSLSRLNMLKMVASIFMAVFIAMLGSTIVILFFVWARSSKRPRISDGSETYSIPKEDTCQECETELKVAETGSGSNRFFRSFRSTRGSYGSTLQGSSCGGSMSDHQLARVLATSSFASSDQESPLPPSPSEFRLWISLNELEIATNYFSQMNLLRKSAHSAVYKGTLPSDGSAVAVKCIYNTRFWFGKKDLRFVIEALTHINHENVVQFKGFCVTKGGSECFLVYPFVAGGTLEQRLHGNVSEEKFLDWAMRVKIMGDVAKGLQYLHDGGKQAIVHQNLWAGNILLSDKDGMALLSDYGLNDIIAEEDTYSSQKQLASLGYLAPEYGYMARLNDKSEVYSFGALSLELLTGRRPVFVDGKNCSSFISTYTWVKTLLQLTGNISEVIDPRLGSLYPASKAAGLLNIALSCMVENPFDRPTMGIVVEMLNAWEGH
ncbi:hypothetical protein CY35_07G071000 [Sphagnum magellanicum]|uniref:Uncharacterized protein n=2 Tax=Sphagnum magellanicum TaxID=128215 RepID=A0ACB8HLQ8_9BRYO|nr:hypothetical protein CY35_07G071000 [Sphagnum magellanicum]KAH9557173.1 hypothetical protein CY35_07G071000 [Sphagnum magellanicum]